MKKPAILIIILLLCIHQTGAFVPMGYLWPISQLPLAYAIQPSVIASNSDSIKSGLDVWSRVETTLFEFSYSGTSTLQLGQDDGVNNIGFGTSLQWGSTLGVTLIWYDPSTETILDADIEFNSLINWGSEYDLMTVAIHEAGHVAGLDHETGEESIMQPYYSGRRQELYQDDIDGISALYPGKKNFVTDHIFQNAPNPFVPDTSDDYTVIGYSVADSGPVKLEIYNLAGELVKVLLDEHKEKGEYIGTQGIRWYGDNGSANLRGKDISSGVYVAVLRTPRSKVQTRKILIVR